MRKYIFSVVLSCLVVSLYGQWECPSQLGGSLKPLGDSKFLWGTEFTLGAGYLTNNSIYNTMWLLGMDYTSNQHTFYFEGGFKYWYRTDFDLHENYYNARLGFREGYYQYHGLAGSITIGLQSMRSEENYLLNERVLGLNYKRSFGSFALNMFGGTVSKDFARNGTFCNMSYLYDILPYKTRSFLGNSLGQTNMAGFTLGFQPGKSKKSTPVGDDGLGVDESVSQSFLHVETIGFAFYTEFGSWLSTPTTLSGFYSALKIGNDFWFKPEILYQKSSGNDAVIYVAKAEKIFTWSNSHRTTIEATYFGLVSIDGGAKAMNLFSNIFSGNVLRLDSPDLPFYQTAVKYTIPKMKTHLKLQYTGQAISDPMQEFDMEAGKKFYGKLLINCTYGYCISPLLTKNPNLFRVEFRLDL